MQNFDSIAEERLLGGLVNNAIDGFIAIESFDIKSGDFVFSEYQNLFYILKQYIDENNPVNIDRVIIKIKLNTSNLFVSEDVLDAIFSCDIKLSNICDYAKIVKTCSLLRKCINRTTQLLNDTTCLDGSTDYNVLCKLYDGAIDDLSQILSNTDNKSFKHIYETVGQTLNDLISGKTKVGLICPTFPLWMSAIGGSIRRSSLNVISGSVKDGKSALCLSVANDIAIQKIPVLYIDTELITDYQAFRLLSTRTDVPLKRVEYGSFTSNPDEYKKISNDILIEKDDLPIAHLQSAGSLLDDIIMAIKRYIVGIVGRDENDNIRDCLIVFDYLKVATHKEYAVNIPEYQILGIICTKLHDLAVKYNVPIIMAAQLNAEGNIGASRRIDHLCSNRTIIRRKSNEELSYSQQWGNRKLSVPISRFSPPMNDNDYIHIDMSYMTGKFKEFGFHSELSKNINVSVKKKDKNEETMDGISNSW